ncbi:MAG: hypothetical protein R6W79_10510, partial [Acidimicrobiia bacterium]
MIHTQARLVTMSVKSLIVAAAVATILAGCSSGADQTTTSGAITTTSGAITTTSGATTTTSGATTTTTDPEAALELSDEGLQVGDTWVPFGTGDAQTIAAISGILGAPNRDSGWIDSFSEYGTCPGSTV